MNPQQRRPHAGLGPDCRAAPRADAAREFLWPSRRQVLRTGLLGALALWGGGLTDGWLPSRAWAADEGAGLTFFRAKDLAMVRAVMASFLDWALPSAPAARQEALKGAVGAADRYFSTFTPAVQAEYRQAFDLLGLAPVRWLGGLWSAWDAAPAASVNAYLEGLRTGRLGLSRQLFLLLEGVAVAGWYSQPASWVALGYPGPPAPARPSGERPL
jgi:hypothetical protein